jgi:hypothetical protein
MKDRRKTKRRYLLYYMRVFDTASHEQIGNLVDITPQGMMVISEHPLPVGNTYQLRLELTHEVSEKPHMEFEARSVWCRPDVDPAYFNTGFNIPKLSTKDVQIINKINANFSFRDNRLVKNNAEGDQ